jgi:arsenate reductase
MTAKGPTIEFLYFEGCPHWIPAYQTLETVAARLAPAATIRKIQMETDQQARKENFQGSPSIRVDGIDLQGLNNKPSGMTCRTYGENRTVPEWMIEAAILRALKPKNILFVCVANAARSQMAEGLARSMAPASVSVYSAGSLPWGVHPLSIEAMAEIDIDISEQRSNGFDAVPLDRMDALITLCAEEACPWVDTQGPRLHWALADPGGSMGTEKERLDAFRRTRDELVERLTVLFLPGPG